MLRHKEDIRTLAFVATYFTLLVAAWVATPEHPALIALMAVLIGFFGFFGAVITHNVIHAPIFKSKRVNRLFQVVLTQTYGHPVSTFVPGHNLSHHKHTQTPRDVMRTDKTRHRWHFLNLFLFMPHVSGDIMKNDFLYGRAMRTQRPKWFRQLMLEAAVFLGISVALIVIDWKKWLIFWQLPHMYAGWGIITMNLLQHDGCDQDHEWNHSRNFVGKVINWFTFNNGYHTIHHMKPSLHWSKLPQAHAELVAPHIHPALDQESILTYGWKTFVWPGQRLTYDGKPLELGPKVKDQPWIPGIKDTPADVSLGAEA